MKVMRAIPVIALILVLAVASVGVGCTSNGGDGNGDTTSPVISTVSALSSTETGFVITWNFEYESGKKPQCQPQWFNSRHDLSLQGEIEG
jgi:hypothetical protein